MDGRSISGILGMLALVASVAKADANVGAPEASCAAGGVAEADAQIGSPEALCTDGGADESDTDEVSLIQNHLTHGPKKVGDGDNHVHDGFLLPAEPNVDEEDVNVTSESALLATHVDEDWNWYGSWEHKILLAHNHKRCMHKVPEFKWDWKLARQAEAWAKKKKMGHSPSSSRRGAGENAAWGNGGDAAKVVKMWYDEISHTYGGKVSSFQSNTGHYSQVVWKGSLKVGCGRSVGSGNPYGAGVFCQYSPAGNSWGQFEENVNGPKISENKCTKLRDSKLGSINRCWSNYGNTWCYTRTGSGYYASSKCESYDGYGTDWCCPDRFGCKER